MKNPFLWLLTILLLVSCQLIDDTTDSPPQSNSSTATEAPSAATDDQPTSGEPDIRSLTVLYTNDEHGWMLGMRPGSGSAEMVGLWRAEHGYRTDDDSFLVLSGGDMWTGPAISTWFNGESMADVLNTMGYSAAAIGNHEFDFGMDNFTERAKMSTFPFVGSNIRYAGSDETPADVGIEPFVIREHNGIQVAILGLTTTSTPRTTNPANVSQFDFLDYDDALFDIVPEAKRAGAELIVVPGHICSDEMAALSRQVASLGVHLIGGGHCNELLAEARNGIINLVGGFHMSAYAWAELEFDIVNDELVSAEFGTAPNRDGEPDPQVFEVVKTWEEEANEELNTEIGYLERDIPRRSPQMENLITYSWLEALPTADVAVTNLGGIRSKIGAGPVTLADVIGVMPFDNVIIEVELTGDEFISTFADRASNLAFAGVRQAGVRWILEASDEPLDPNKTYTILVNDFMYAGGDGFTFLQRFDPDAYNTAIDWRQPVIDWIIDEFSDQSAPLDDAVNALGSY